MSIKKTIGIGTMVVVAFLGFATFMGSWYEVEEGTRDVLLRNGGMVDVKEPGLHFKLPFIESTVNMDVRNRTLQQNVYVYSSDTQQYTATVAVNYRIAVGDVGEVFANEGVNYASSRLWPLVVTKLKEVAGKYSAQQTVQNRNKFGSDVLVVVVEEAAKYRIIVSEVQISNIDFKDEFEAAIESAMLEKAAVEKAKSTLLKEEVQAQSVVVKANAAADAARAAANGQADVKVAQAEAEATANLLTATAEAKAIKMKGDAEASSMKAKSSALKSDPGLIEYTRALAMGNWQGGVPATMLGGAPIPLLQFGGGDLIK